MRIRDYGVREYFRDGIRGIAGLETLRRLVERVGGRSFPARGDHGAMSPGVALPTRCERLVDIAVRHGGTVDRRGTETRVDYALPTHATPEVRESFSAFASTVCDPEIVARLPGGRVVGAGIVVSPDGTSIARDVSLDFGKSASDHWLLGRKSLGPPVNVAGPVTVIASTLASGYAHWLHDELPRLLLLKASELAPCLIAHAGHEFARTALARYGWKGRLLAPAWRAHFQCEELIVPGLVGHIGRATPRTAQLLSEFAAPSLAAASAFGERIYISREGARRRRVLNEAALWGQLEARGFANVRLEALTWSEQIAAFRHAKVVVAPHGAGLANLVFCRPGTRVVEFFHRAYVNGCYWQIAAVNGLDYRPVVAAGESPLALQSFASRFDIEADISQVLAMLAGM